MGEEVLSSLHTRRLLWECEKDETPQECMRRGGSTLAKRTKCIQAASLKATFYMKTPIDKKRSTLLLGEVDKTL